MNGASGTLVRPIRIRVRNDETGEERVCSLPTAADTIVNPFKVRALQNELIETVTGSLERNYKTKLQNISSEYDTTKAIVVDEVDARQTIQDLSYASNCIPKIIKDSTDSLYDLAVSEHNNAQRLYNERIRNNAINVRNSMGEEAYICPEEYMDFSSGGSN